MFVSKFVGGVFVASLLFGGGSVLIGCSNSEDSSVGGDLDSSIESNVIDGSDGSSVNQVVSPIFVDVPADGNSAPVGVNVSVGEVVVFNITSNEKGTYVAVSSDSSVFEVIGDGEVREDYTSNPNGVAKAAGNAAVKLQYVDVDGVNGPEFLFVVTVE